MRVLCVGCLVRLAAGVRRIQDALANHIFTELQTAAEHGQDDASPTEPSLRYVELRVFRDDGRAIGEVSLASGQKRKVFEVRADRDTLTWWRRIWGGRRVYLLGRKKDGLFVVVGALTSEGDLGSHKLRLAPTRPLAALVETPNGHVRPVDEQVLQACEYLLNKSPTTLW